MVMGELTMEVDVAVIGGGPGGYVAAIRAADLGFNVVLIEEKKRLGGVCLLEGCIPSKTLIHAVELADEATHAKKIGLNFSGFEFDIDALRKWTEKVVNGLSHGIDYLLEKRGVEVVTGHAKFTDNTHLQVDGAGISIEFKNAIIATGSKINVLPDAVDLPLWTSAEALTIPYVPERLLIIGGGYIGMEIGFVYAGLGSKITLVEPKAHLLCHADEDMVDVVMKSCKKKFEKVMVESKVGHIKQSSGGFTVEIIHKDTTENVEFEQVLMAVGRHPYSDDLGLENTKIEVDQYHRIPNNEECRTVEPNIFAIGDCAPGPMLAHKATREGKIAAEVIANHPSAMDNRAIPAVVFTHPEMSWVGLSENEAQKKGVKYAIGKFPLNALGRARSIGKTDGFVKILSDPDNDDLILGVGIVGEQASELISEATLAIEMGATLEDILSTVHPHPTMSESLMEAAEVAAGVPIHVLPKSKK